MFLLFYFLLVGFPYIAQICSGRNIFVNFILSGRSVIFCFILNGKFGFSFTGTLPSLAWKNLLKLWTQKIPLVPFSLSFYSKISLQRFFFRTLSDLFSVIFPGEDNETAGGDDDNGSQSRDRLDLASILSISL